MSWTHKNIKQALLAGAAVLLFIVLMQNTQVVSIRFLFWQISMSRIILLPLVMLTGGLIGFVLGKRF